MTTGIEPARPRFAVLRELLVPSLMIGLIIVYAADSLHLSFEAMVLPVALIAVIVVALAWCLVSGLSPAGRHAQAMAADSEDEEAGGPILDWRPWLIVAIPAVLTAFLDTLGAAAALVALVFGAQMIFDRRSPARSLAIAVAVTAPTWALFKYVLYVRFPPGVLGLG